MKGELVSILTADHVRLDGLYVESTTATVKGPFDAAVISHGLGGNFYGAKLLKQEKTGHWSIIEKADVLAEALKQHWG